MFTEGLATSSDDRRKAAEFGDPAPAVGFSPQTVARIRAQVIHRPSNRLTLTPASQRYYVRSTHALRRFTVHTSTRAEFVRNGTCTRN